MRGDDSAYQTRVNRVVDHIGAHLGEPLTLASLASVAAFSPFHFHRVFKAATGETLFGFIMADASEVLFALRVDRVMHTRWENVLQPGMHPVHTKWKAAG